MTARPAEIAVVDYGAGNLRSVGGALARLGATWRLVRSPDELHGAGAVLLPGVGSAGAAMRELERRGIAHALRGDLRPLLGICLGLQLLFETSEEEGGVRCLGLLPGRATRLRNAPKLPHMGWNVASPVRAHALFDDVAGGGWFYFAHSFGCECPEDLAVALTEHGGWFVSAAGDPRVCGVQFHPEKSGAAGMRVLAGWLRSVGALPEPARSGNAVRAPQEAG